MTKKDFREKEVSWMRKYHALELAIGTLIEAGYDPHGSVIYPLVERKFILGERLNKFSPGEDELNYKMPIVDETVQNK